ncbi:MAG TPA: SDR family NAD(P)-dependent oxidoreductase [Saprospiraceae bacterium]|nr:SDR family NAD(P)-dependent oxidoreductase [Saprospiraceae bacterium]
MTKTIFITGATSGIGLATAEKFANEGGCRLILAGRRRNRLLQIKEAIAENYDIDTEILQFDVRDYVAVKEAIGSLNAPFNRIDVLINNAGLALGLSSIASGELSDWETMIDTNIKGLLYTTKEVAPMMIAQNGGQIINIGSIAGKEAYPNGNVYNATKAAVEILTKAMRLDLHKYNIRVGQVAPGHVETEFALNRFHGDEAKAKIYEDFTPLSARDIANIIYFMVNQPPHVNIQDVLVFPTQQASATVIHRSGRQN